MEREEIVKHINDVINDPDNNITLLQECAMYKAIEMILNLNDKDENLTK